MGRLFKPAQLEGIDGVETSNHHDLIRLGARAGPVAERAKERISTPATGWPTHRRSYSALITVTRILMENRADHRHPRLPSRCVLRLCGRPHPCIPCI